MKSSLETLLSLLPGRTIYRTQPSLAERTGVRFPKLYKPSGDVVKQHEVFNLLRDNLLTPSTFVIDGYAAIRYKHVGRGISDRPLASTIIQLLDRFNG